MSDDANVPMDAVAENAKAIVQAAIEWRRAVGPSPVMTAAEWKLFAACEQYGDRFKGLRAQ